MTVHEKLIKYSDEEIGIKVFHDGVELRIKDNEDRENRIYLYWYEWEEIENYIKEIRNNYI